MTKYDSGRRIEYAIQHWLEERGYKTTRSAGSKGVFDVIAYNSLVVRFIQAKRETNKTSYRSELDKILVTPVPENCTRELWVYTKGKGFTLVYVVSGVHIDIEHPGGASIREA